MSQMLCFYFFFEFKFFPWYPHFFVTYPNTSVLFRLDFRFHLHQVSGHGIGADGGGGTTPLLFCLGKTSFTSFTCASDFVGTKWCCSQGAVRSQRDLYWKYSSGHGLPPGRRHVRVFSAEPPRKWDPLLLGEDHPKLPVYTILSWLSRALTCWNCGRWTQQKIIFERNDHLSYRCICTWLCIPLADR